MSVVRCPEMRMRVEHQLALDCTCNPDRPYVQETNVIRQCSFYVLFISCYSAKCVCVIIGDVHCKYIPVRHTSSAGLVISPPDKIFLYTAMNVIGPIRPSVTGPLSLYKGLKMTRAKLEILWKYKWLCVLKVPVTTSRYTIFSRTEYLLFMISNSHNAECFYIVHVGLLIWFELELEISVRS